MGGKQAKSGSVADAIGRSSARQHGSSDKVPESI
jgi:hypothetical protein